VPNFAPIGQQLRMYDDFFQDKDSGRPILDFQILEILTVGTLKRDRLHCRANFRPSRSNRARDMASFRFYKMATGAILDFKKEHISKGRQDQESRIASLCQILSKSVKLR